MIVPIFDHVANSEKVFMPRNLSGITSLQARRSSERIIAI